MSIPGRKLRLYWPVKRSDCRYEFEKRYSKMEKENRELTEVIFDYLVQEGSDYAVDESGEKLRKRIKKQYERVMEAQEEIG